MKGVDIRKIGLCFEGIVPATIYTISEDGTPNVSYVSYVHMVDSRHIATSYQFFSKTRANILNNPKAVIEVLDPYTMQPYSLRVRFQRSEFDGVLFELMAQRLQVIASHEGMSEIFSLKAADIYEVIEVDSPRDYTRLTQISPSQESPETPKFEVLHMITERIAKTKNLEQLFERTLDMLAKFYGYTHMKVFLLGDSPGTLITYSSHGYEITGVGSEVHLGEGIIGLAAQSKKALKISGVDLGRRYAKATRDSLEHSKQTAALSMGIPLPGLANPASQIAVPMQSSGDLVGVLAIESATKKHWTTTEKCILSVIANQLGSSTRALSVQEESQQELPKPSVNSSSVNKKKFSIKFIESEESIFLNDAYLIKNMPAKILWHLLKEYKKTGRLDFSNMELRCQAHLNLSEFKHNLEARLVLLKKRLQQNCGHIRIVNTSRGRFRLEVDGEVELSEIK